MNERRWLIATVGVIVALTVIAVVIVAIRGGFTASTFEVGSPEAVVGEFVQAILDRDLPTARSLLAEGAAAGCSASAFTRAAVEATKASGGPAPRWSLLWRERKDLASGAVQVKIRILRTEASPPWGVTSEANDATFVLEGVGDAARIVSFDWPGPCW